MASVLGCFRGSYRQHATKGFHGNKGDPSGSSLTCRVRQAEQARKIRRPDGRQTAWKYFEVGRAGYMGKRAAEVELFVGNMSSIQREDSAFYAKRRSASHDNRTRTNRR